MQTKCSEDIVQALENDESTAEELRFVKAVAAGLADIRNGNTVSAEQAKQLLDIS